MSLETIALVTAGVSAAGALVSGVAQAGQANRAASVAKANAKSVVQEGVAEAGLIRERARRMKGTNKANIGASGVDISSFSDVLDDNDISAEMDAQTAIRNSKVQANNFKAEAEMNRSSGAGAMIGGAVGAGAQALSGYGNWRLLKTMSPDAPGFWSAPASGHGGAR